MVTVGGMLHWLLQRKNLTVKRSSLKGDTLSKRITQDLQTLHFYGSFWPHSPGFNQLNVEAAIPDSVFNELRARGHNVSRLRTFGMSGCATAVMIDPATQNRFAAADPRRDCYAIAY